MIKSLFRQSRCSLGSRGIRSMLLNQDISVGRYLVRRLMRELRLVSKQRKRHKYQSNVDDIPVAPKYIKQAI